MTKLQQRQSRSPRIRNVIGFSLLIIGMFCVIVVYQGTQAYKQAIIKANQNASKLTTILADHVELTFLGVDLSLRRAIERQYFNTLFGNNIPEYTEQNFKVWLNETPQIAALAMINEDGVVDVAAHKRGYEHWLDYNKSLVGQKLFERMRAADDADVFIGKHYTEDNQSLIIMSRRFNKLDGNFGGIVVAAINPKYFVDFYDSIGTGSEKYMALMLRDGTVLASGSSVSVSDERAAREWLVEQEIFGSDVRSTMNETNDEGQVIVALKALGHIPVAVSIVTHNKDFLSDWRQSRLRDIGFLALFIIFGSTLSFFAIATARQIMRVEESESAAILASQAKSEFLANMSHELRTPLNAIIGFSEMINSGYFGPLNPKQKERIHDINLCGTHLLQLITDILEFSKGDAGKLELIEEKVDMAEMVNESVRIMNGKIRTKGIHLVVAIDPDTHNLNGDKRKIRQVLINLLSNAVKFTPEGGTITVSVRPDQQGNINMIVSDTGIGIAESDIPKALSVFGQVHRSKSHEGTGLGLPLCKMYADLHDGKLLLTSRLGEGTTVRVIFPHSRVMGR
ncbi:MAG: hybrid sensor histidine kinase/response regulator [Alphaproteobacteria bacterium]|nr:hybrid sensor histidine kinase/response regulator [Alphaproteobacteria bacterium]